MGTVNKTSNKHICSHEQVADFTLHVHYVIDHYMNVAITCHDIYVVLIRPPPSLDDYSRQFFFQSTNVKAHLGAVLALMRFIN